LEIWVTLTKYKILKILNGFQTLSPNETIIEDKTVEDLGYITEKSSKNIFPNQVW